MADRVLTVINDEGRLELHLLTILVLHLRGTREKWSLRETPESELSSHALCTDSSQLSNTTYWDTLQDISNDPEFFFQTRYGRPVVDCLAQAREMFLTEELL